MKRYGMLTIVLMLIFTGCTPAADTLTYTGSVEAEEIDISPEINGTIVSVGVEEGQSVKQGQMLFTLDTKDYGVKLEMVQKTLEIAQQKASDLADGNSTSQIRQAQASVGVIQEQINSSIDEIEYLKKELERIETLHSAGVTTGQQLDTATRALEREQEKYQGLLKQKEASNASLSVVEEGATKQVKASAQMEVQLKSLEIQDLEQTILKGVVGSPMDGVVQTVNYSKGERVGTSQKVITLINVSDLYMKIYVPEKKLHRVQKGMEVQFEDGFLKDKNITGIVTYISNKAEFTPKNIESKENKQEMVYEVRIKITDSEGIVKPGMFVDVTLKEGKS